MRRFKAQISVDKLTYMFRSDSYTNFNELKTDLMHLTSKFYTYLGADEKPEKGERKMADDQVLLIADIIDNYVKINSNISLEIFKMCLLEQAYEASNYNFDVQLSLMRSFDKLGLCTSFAESYDTLDIKGV